MKSLIDMCDREINGIEKYKREYKNIHTLLENRCTIDDMCSVYKRNGLRYMSRMNTMKHKLFYMSKRNDNNWFS